MMMKKRDLVIEIGCEDLPAWSGDYLRDKWLPVLTSLFDEYRVTHGPIRFFHTVRRLVLYIKDVEERQSDVTTEIYGPPADVCSDGKGQFSSAARNFARSYGLEPAELLVKEKKGKRVLVAVRKENGRPLSEILGTIIEESIKKTEIPRGMRWNESDFKFMRPIRWILVLFGKQIVRLCLGGVKSERYSFGHRILSPERFSVAEAEDYLDKALKKCVIFDPEIRYEFIKKNICRKIRGEKYSMDEAHVKRISNLVEYPAVEVCILKDEHVDMPDEVTSAIIMKLNGIPLFENSGMLHNEYIAVFDGTGGSEIKDNYQNVLEAKMEDAMFFMGKDMQVEFKSYAERLKNIIYHPKWGSVYERIERFRKIYEVLLDYLDIDDAKKDNIALIISLCKNDIPTLMVTEFPVLEGVIGRIYAKKSGYSTIVSSAIEQHYLPRYSGDKLPETDEAAIVSLIARIEAICSFMIDNTRVTGAGDPYGLKKLANGLVEIIWSRKFNLPLKHVINRTLDVFNCSSEKTGNEIFDFISQRVENILAGEGVSPGIRRAVMSVDRENLVALREKIDALEKFFESGKGAKSILVPFIRVANILKQAGEKGIEPGQFDENLLAENTEKQLYSFYRSEGELKTLYEDKKYGLFLQHMSGWKGIIDRYFDDVLIMCPDEKLRNNRLALLRKINEMFNLFADFSLIPIVEVDNAQKD